MAYKRILLATDGSPSARTPERVAAGLARATKGSVTVVHAYSSSELAPASVERAVGILDEAGVKHEVVLSGDEPAEAVLAEAEAREAEVIVIGSRGLLREEQVFGSVVKKVAQRAPCDVLLTRGRDGDFEDAGQPRAPYRRILIATDGSATADRAARKGFALAKRLDAEVVLVFVGHPRTGDLILRDTVATIADEGAIGARTTIRDGEPAQAIMAAADEEGSDLVVVGNRGMTGARAALLGSIPLTVAQYARADVLIARTIAQSLEEIGPGEGGIVTTGDHKVAVYRDDRGTVHAHSAKCTHMGCTVKWNPAERTFDCPCHGSRFSPVGEVVNGPAARPLEPSDL
jgi:nucleotide-binding universal stress UspA family protein/nitrite reductase/ring-hydroxylating ferredoxin subunit